MFQTVVFREFNNFSSLLLPLYQLVSNVFLQKNSEKVQIYKNLWQNCCIHTIFSWLYIKQDRILFYLCLTQSLIFFFTSFMIFHQLWDIGQKFHIFHRSFSDFYSAHTYVINDLMSNQRKSLEVWTRTERSDDITPMLAVFHCFPVSF